jgi:TPP-dependent pyruvate/acetoin dehydrogenase alpha subunit
VSTLLEAEAALAALGPTPYPLPLGPMAPIVEGGFSGMNKGDWVVCGMRERIGAVLRGCPPERLVDGRAGAKPYKLAPVSEAPGTRALHAVGLAKASGRPVLCFLGLASAASGDFYEALNATVLTGAPVIFLVAVHPLTDDAPVGPQLGTTPDRLGAAFGLETAEIKGTAKAVQAAVKAARKKGIAALITATVE